MTGSVDPKTGNRNAGLSEMIANGITTGKVYDNIVEKVEIVSAALAEAKKELATLENNEAEQLANLAVNLDYRLAQIKADTLNAVMLTLQERLNLLSRESISGDKQSDAQVAFERTSIALAEARKELVLLESQLGYDRLAMDLDYQVAQEKVDNLNVRMEALTYNLSLLQGGRIDPSEITGYLVAGKSTIPYPVVPGRRQARNFKRQVDCQGNAII
jgi:hypothetical protein